MKDSGRPLLLKQNDELTELAKSINAMLDRLQSGFDIQSNFVSNASHELKTPAAVFANYAELLESYGTNDAEVFNESIKAIKAEAAYLSNMLKNLAAFTNNSKVFISKFDVKPIIAEVVNFANYSNITIENNPNANILANPAAFKQLVRMVVIDNGRI